MITDFNNDGKLDIVLGMGDARAIAPNPSDANIGVLYGNGDGTFQGTTLYNFSEPQYSSPL